MKLLPTLLLAGVLAAPVTLPAAPADNTPSAPVASEVVDLAKGYERAFADLTPGRTVLYWRFAERIVRTPEVIAVQARGGTVVVEIPGRDRLVLDPRSIVLLTDSLATF